MTKKRNIYFIFLILLFMLPFISICYAQTTEYYVGINENDTYIFLTSFNKDPYEKYLEDYYIGEGVPDSLAETWAEEDADYFFNNSLDEDIEAYRLWISKVSLEEDKYYGEKGVSYYFNLYTSEDRAANDWEQDVHDGKAVIYKYDKAVYKFFAHANFGLFLRFIIANDVDWLQLADKIDDDYDDYNITDADAEALPNGLTTSWEDNDDTEEFTTISRYTSKGILSYYECAYDGEIMIKIELELSFFMDFWILIIILLCLAAVPGIILLVKDIKEF